MEENIRTEKSSRKGSWAGALIIGISIIISCAAIAFGLAHFKSDSEHTIAATGSASVDFEADTIIWRGTYSAWALSSKDAYKILKSMSSETPQTVYTSNSIEELVGNFINILEQTQDKTPTSSTGVIQTTVANTLVVNSDK